MNNAMPPLHESAAELQELLRQERHVAKRQRLHVLYLLATGQARRRTDLARLLGLDRNTIGHWLRRYQAGGLPALLDLYVPSGKASALTPDQRAQLQQRLQDPAGFGSYAAIQEWIATAFGVSMSYNAVYKLVHNTLRARPKVARTSHEKKVARP